ncbi:MAG: methyltransferase domain-containing protein [Planctomycetota bacterium]
MSASRLARDRISQTYLGKVGNAETQAIARARIDWLSEQVSGPMVLDLGCSEGILPLLLARRGLEVTGVDINEDAVAYARELLDQEPDVVRTRVRFIAGNALVLSLPEASFDTVVLGEVIEHLEAPERMLDVACHCLKKGGRLLVTTPLGHFPDADHLQTFSLSAFVSLLRSRISPERLDVADGYVRFVGRSTEPTDDAWERIASPQRLLDMVEESLIHLQQRLHDRLAKTTSLWKQACEDARRWKESAERLEVECRSKVDALAEAYKSKQFRIGDAMIRAAHPSMDTLRLPGFLYRIFKEPRRNREDPSSILPAAPSDRVAVLDRHAQCLADFEQYSAMVAEGAYDHFFVMFGGTTHIQGIRANRPIRLTRSLETMRIPVLFNFHRWKETDHIPPYDGGLVFQSPIDKTPQFVQRLVCSNLGSTRGVFVVSYPHPAACRLVNLANANGWATIYDCRDDWEEFEKVGMAKWYKSSAEKYIVNNCDTTCCVSRPLQQTLSAFAATRRIRLLPNAYDPAFLDEGYRHEPDGQPRVGYFGHLTDRWFDWKSLLWIAAQRPNYRFEIVGHGAPKKLSLPANVTLLGAKTHAEICQIAARWNVGIIPFKVGRLADGVDPIKIYEYFGLGLPVVSFRMPQVADYPYTTTVDTREEYVEALDHAMGCQCDMRIFEEFLAKNTWDTRVRTMIQWANEALDQEPCEKTFCCRTTTCDRV